MIMSEHILDKSVNHVNNDKIMKVFDYFLKYLWVVFILLVFMKKSFLWSPTLIQWLQGSKVCFTNVFLGPLF